MPNPTPTPTTDQSADETVTYENVRVVVTPEAPRHYEVKVSERGDDVTRHAVERVVINTAEVILDGPIWFIDAELDVGIPIGKRGDTAWVWV